MDVTGVTKGDWAGFATNLDLGSASDDPADRRHRDTGPRSGRYKARGPICRNRREDFEIITAGHHCRECRGVRVGERARRRGQRHGGRFDFGAYT